MDKINKIRGAIALAVMGTIVISLFIMGMIGVAAYGGRWEFVDKWITMLFSSLVSNAFLGFLYVKTNNKKDEPA